MRDKGFRLERQVQSTLEKNGIKCQLMQQSDGRSSGKPSDCDAIINDTITVQIKGRRLPNYIKTTSDLMVFVPDRSEPVVLLSLDKLISLLKTPSLLNQV